MTPITEEVLASIRKLIRASDVYSSKVRQLSGLTSAQLLLLRAIEQSPSASLGELARQISLSQATTSTILKRLESAGFTYKTRSENDRRRSQVFLTESGSEALARAPKPLDQDFLDRFQTLKPYEQSAIVSSLQRVADMMESRVADIIDDNHSLDSNVA
jgi:DNA-binding MarR family transcriptional regulator